MVWWAVACKVVQVARVLSKVRESTDHRASGLHNFNACMLRFFTPGE